MLHSVMWVCLCIPGHIHCSCSTVMALLRIPISELVSFAFSTMSLFRIFVYIYEFDGVPDTLLSYVCVFPADEK